MNDLKAERRKRKREIIKQISFLEVRSERGESVDDEIKKLGEELENMSEGGTVSNFGTKEDAESLTEEHYKIAEENGIGKSALKERFYNLGWSAMKSATHPLPLYVKIKDSGLTKEVYLKEKKELSKDEEIAARFNISISSLDKWKTKNKLTRKHFKERGEWDI